MVFSAFRADVVVGPSHGPEHSFRLSQAETEPQELGFWDCAEGVLTERLRQVLLDMLAQVALLRKDSVAVQEAVQAAQIWLLVGVYPQMVEEVVPLLEQQAALPEIALQNLLFSESRGMAKFIDDVLASGWHVVVCSLLGHFQAVDVLVSEQLPTDDVHNLAFLWNLPPHVPIVNLITLDHLHSFMV